MHLCVKKNQRRDKVKRVNLKQRIDKYSSEKYNSEAYAEKAVQLVKRIAGRVRKVSRYIFGAECQCSNCAFDATFCLLYYCILGKIFSNQIFCFRTKKWFIVLSNFSSSGSVFHLPKLVDQVLSSSAPEQSVGHYPQPKREDCLHGQGCTQGKVFLSLIMWTNRF